MKKRIMTLLILSAMLVSLCAIPAYAVEGEPDRPSEKFIELYSEVFSNTASYQVYDRQGNLITEEFVETYRDNFINNDFVTIWNSVAENGYLLKFGTPYYVPVESQSRAAIVELCAYSEWTYELEELDELLSGKYVEFMYRVAGTYTSNGSKIIDYETPWLEIEMTFPGTLFPYETEPTFTTTVNSAGTQIAFNMQLEITFQYNYSEQIWQKLGPYYATATGRAS